MGENNLYYTSPEQYHTSNYVYVYTIPDCQHGYPTLPH